MYISYSPISFFSKRLAATVSLTFIGLYSVQVKSQTLNDTINDLLRVGPNGVACESLLGSSLASDILTGQLNTLCSRPIGQNVSASSAVTGGGAATSTSLPTIVQKRLKKKELKETGGSAGDSFEAISEFGNNWNVFFSGGYQSLNRNLTTFEDGYKSDLGNVTAGIDKLITERFLAGAAFNYSHQNGNFASAGDFSNNAYGGMIYASYNPTDNSFIQVNAGYSYRDYNRNRFATFIEATTDTNVAGFAKGAYSGNDYNVAILTGYDWNLGNFTLGPRAGFNWVKNEYNNYSERGNSGLELHFYNDQRVSTQSSFGLFTSYALSTGFGVIVPQAGVDWIHEFDNNQRNIRFSFVGDTRNSVFTFNNERPDRDFVEINAGTSLVLPNGLQAYINYRGIAGHSYYDGHGVNTGIRLEF